MVEIAKVADAEVVRARIDVTCTPRPRLVARFLDFIGSAQGQAVIAADGACR